jgi:hypothetical protein
MRGKLRDKSSINRRGALRRTDGEQRQPYKRDTRGMQWIGEPQDDDEVYDFEETSELEEEEEDLKSESVPLKETPIKDKEAQKK